jgi:lipopolysaccharide transport system ATP-binding protein
MSATGPAGSDQKPALTVLGLGKAYQIFSSPKDRLKQAALDWLQNIGMLSRPRKLYSEKRALNDISFELARGEAIGIVGMNGAGKSTLLQLIAGTIKPTEGEVRFEGRLTSLLELGSGFASEVSGRDNILVAGQINGLSRAEIEPLVDEVVAFADIGEYIDRPVKTYSTGMTMRLAFAIQTAVSPDILIVDEAMAVGDLNFQAKCMRKMQGLRETGTALLFVSHSMSTVREVCNRAILLNRGSAVCHGSADFVVHEYQKLLSLASEESFKQSKIGSADDRAVKAAKSSHAMADASDQSAIWGTDASDAIGEFSRNASEQRDGNAKAKVNNVTLIGETGKNQTQFYFGEAAKCRIFLSIDYDVPYLHIAYKIKTLAGIAMIYGDSSLTKFSDYRYVRGQSYVVDFLVSLHLAHGDYILAVDVSIPSPKVGINRTFEYVDRIATCRTFQISPRNDGMIGGGVVLPFDIEISPIKPLSNDNCE